MSRIYNPSLSCNYFYQPGCSGKSKVTQKNPKLPILFCQFLIAGRKQKSSLLYYFFYLLFIFKYTECSIHEKSLQSSFSSCLKIFLGRSADVSPPVDLTRRLFIGLVGLMCKAPTEAMRLNRIASVTYL